MLILSCSPEKQLNDEKIDGVHQLQINGSAGDYWEEGDQYLTMPFNVGSIDNTKVILIADKMNKDQLINIELIGAVVLDNNGKEETILLSIPSDQEKKVIDVEDFDEFSTVYSSAKWIIEQYLLNRSGNKKVKLKKWENETFAKNYLSKDMLAQ